MQPSREQGGRKGVRGREPAMAELVGEGEGAHPAVQVQVRVLMSFLEAILTSCVVL